jgi:hypothetical protein
MRENVISLNVRPRKPLGPPHLRVAEVVFLKPASRNEQARREADAGAPRAGDCRWLDDYE